jgi:glycyl-tRNA synthetase beta chain
VKRDLVFEVGTEELPSQAVYSAIEQLQTSIPEAFDDARLSYGVARVIASPRRLAVLVTDLVERQEDRTLRVKGPSLKAAFDAEGNPTKAVEGFARGKGVDVSDLDKVEDESGAYVYAVIEQAGQEALEVLPDLIERALGGIEWPKSMRWGSGDARFSRPVRWLFALYGHDVVPVEFAGLHADRFTFGHRFLAPGPIEVPVAYDYPTALARSKVMGDQEERAALLREGIEVVAAQHQGRTVVPEKTFAEVVNLVEWPTVAVGTFDEGFLEVPREVLENAMGSHQRYFPLESADGSLAARFIVAHNGDPVRTEQIVAGHERVIRARLADAAFFYREDLSRPLEGYVAQLGSIVFQEKLGSLLTKVERVERLTGELARMLDAKADETAWAQRAAHLSKADLVTNVVVEFPKLQGVMGGYYAEAAGEASEVARAIVEHYQPRFSGDDTPASIAGRLVAIADKMDTICGIFAARMAPTGSADPFALRRNAIGLLQMALDGSPVRLDETIAATLAGYADSVAGLDVDLVGGEVKEFILTRLETILRERGHAYDTVEAVLAVAADDPADASERCEALTRFRADSDDMEDLSTAFARAKNLSQRDLGTDVDVSIMGAEERALADALSEAEAHVGTLFDQRAYSAVLETFAQMRGPIDDFFEGVLVMDEDERVRTNRLRLLNRFVSLFERFADFSALAG